MPDVTQILSCIEHGDPAATEQLLALLYAELRRLAAQKLVREKPGQTLQATALVHETYLRLVDAETAQHWKSRGHFFAAAAESMRRILIERARRNAREKHGGQLHRVNLEDQLLIDDERNHELLALDEALGELEQHDANAARLVKLRYFAGMSHQEAAGVMQISRRAADRLWALAKAWLYQRLAKK